MAAVALPKPGSKHGPCAEECRHIDCALTRAQAASGCWVCEKPIGFGVPAYSREASGGGMGWHDFAHAVCVEEQAEKNQ